MSHQPLPADLAELTALRFFAALIVLVYHYAQAWVPGLADASGIVSKGYLGVDFFFVLSGFILTHVYLPAHRAGTFHVLDFIWARFARVYPLHLVTMIFAILLLTIAFRLGQFAQDPVYLRVILANAALVHAWGVTDHFSLNEPSWSISAEWAAYLLFPIFLTATRVGDKRPLAFLAGAVGVLFAAWQGAELMFAKPLTQLAFDGGALRILPCFLVGCALYTVARQVALPRETAQIGLVLAALAVLVLMQVLAFDLLIILAIAAMIFFASQCARAGAGSQPNGLAARPLVYLGEISFAIYMVHRLVEHALKEVVSPLMGFNPDGSILMMTAAFVLTLILSALLYHLVERPARTLMRRAPPSQWMHRANPHGL